MKTSEIQIRDPFVYVENGTYYLYGSTDKNVWTGKGTGFDCYTGTDLENWTPHGNILDRPEGFWGVYNFWAPEMHAYKGKYYLFASFLGENTKRGTVILKADSPLGPFRPWSWSAVTPADWMSLDGTLYVEDSKPYIVFCHEWVQTKDGEMCFMPLTEDLSAPAGEPGLLFRASQCPWAANITGDPSNPGYVTDGPNMYRMKDGTLLMLWSTGSPNGYAIGCARSASGSIIGPWSIDPEPLFDKDGGHGMIFRGLDGILRLTIHTPNNSPEERAVFLEIAEENGKLKIVK